MITPMMYLSLIFIQADFGDVIAGQSGLTGYPSGTVNRHVFSGGATAMSRTQWTSASNQILGEGSYVNVAIETEIDRSCRVATIHVEGYYTGDSPESTNFLNVVILQDNTSGPQSGGSNPYNHMHRLIDMPTGQWGIEIPVTTNSTFVNETFEFTIPVNTRGVPIILDDLKFVAFIAETTQEIISGNGCSPTFVGTAPTSDISLDEIIVDDMVCSGYFTSSIELSNYGTTNINSLEITYQVNDETAEVYNWTGTLNSLETIVIDLPEVTYAPLGTNTFTVSIETDDNEDNNSQSYDVLDASQGITYVLLKFTTDNNGSEFTWQLREPDGSLIDHGSNYDDNTSYTERFEVAPNCYRLDIHDANGNGGTSIVLEDEYTELYSIDGNWGDYKLVRFTTDIAPAAAVTVPEDDSVGASISSNAIIRFDQPIRYLDNSPIPQTNSNLPITFTDGSKTDIACTIFVNSARTKITINPDEDLDYNTEYFVTLTGGILENYYDIEIEDDITFSFTTEEEGASINDINNNIEIYPNPASELVNITNSLDAKIEIFNIVGSKVYSSTSLTETTTIDVSSFTTGTYIIKVTNGSEISTSKFNVER